MRLINVDDLIKKVERSISENPHLDSALKCNHVQEHNHFLYMIAKEPEIDAEPVIRCKDCKQWGCGVPGETNHVKCCQFANYMVGANGFCVFGERKQGKIDLEISE